MARQNGRCATCRLPFRGTSLAVAQRDVLRPLWLAPAELTRPEIDHIDPIGWTGGNESNNLQLLCRACNLAKSDGIRISPNSEATLGCMDIARVPRIYFF